MMEKDNPLSNFKWNKQKLSPAELDSLFSSPEFVRQYSRLFDYSNPLVDSRARDRFLVNLTQEEVDGYIKEGQRLKRKLNKKAKFSNLSIRVKVAVLFGTLSFLIIALIYLFMFQIDEYDIKFLKVTFVILNYPAMFVNSEILLFIVSFVVSPILWGLYGYSLVWVFEKCYRGGK